MARKTIDEAIDELFKDYKKAIKKAAQEATNKAKDDLYVHSLSCLIGYYNDYPDPSRYNRTYNLMNCFVPLQRVTETADGFDCMAGIGYNPARLDYVYSGSQKYDPTDSEWIVDNYLAGIHPRTDGSREVGGGDYENQKYQGSFVPWNEMQKYIDGYNDKFNKNFRFALSKQIMKLM